MKIPRVLGLLALLIFTFGVAPPVCAQQLRLARQLGSSSSDTQAASRARKTDDLEAVRRQIAQLNQQMVTTLKRGDLLGVARFYADDATIFFHRGQKLHGRKTIDGYWTSIKGAKDWKLDVIEVGGSADEIYQIGKSSFTSEAGGKEQSYVCDFVVIWKRQKDGAYKIYVDIYN